MTTLVARLASARGLVLLGSAAVVLLAFVLTPSTEAVSILGFEVPTLCAWRLTLGLECPGCGLTRSFTYLAHGHWVEAFRLNALGPPLFVAVAAQLPWQVYRMLGETPESTSPRDGVAERGVRTGT